MGENAFGQAEHIDFILELLPDIARRQAVQPVHVHPSQPGSNRLHCAGEPERAANIDRVASHTIDIAFT